MPSSWSLVFLWTAHVALGGAQSAKKNMGLIHEEGFELRSLKICTRAVRKASSTLGEI
jgi:hypothetical protein